MADDNKLSMFGKSFNTVGNHQAHLCLCTAGDIKVKTANRFVTIFKDGKLNVDNKTEIFRVSSEDDIKKNGVYLVESDDDQSVYLCVDGTKILLASSSDGYISYTAVQELSADQFTQALSNIGFYFQTLDEAKASGITEGMVYILGEGTLYKVVNGEFIAAIPTIEESSTTEETYDSLQIGGILIDGINQLINANNELVIQIDGRDYIWLKYDKIYVKKDVIIDTSSTVQTDGAQQGSSGFMIYTENGETYLEVDNLIVHNSSSEYEPSLYSAYVGTEIKNLILYASWETAPTSISPVLKYKNDFVVGDYILIQTTEDNTAYISYDTSYDDSGTQKQRIKISLSSAPTQTTVIRVYYEVELDGGELESRSVDITIEPTTIDEDTGETIPNTYGEALIDLTPSIDEISRMTVLSGDESIYYDGESTTNGRTIPAPLIGTVTSLNPFTINVPSQTDSSDSILTNLEGSTIYKIGSNSETEYILYHSTFNISLEETEVVDGTLVRTTHSKIGSLNDIAKPDEDGYFDGYGIYSDNLIAINPIIYKGVFRMDYPVYDTDLDMPEEDFDDEKYDKAIPDVDWVKALIKKKLEWAEL